uniref:Uncharacterized protein n=1 Tax=Caenorhabditis japonica TaxID=281687 RepID=A0A8R1I0A9_CAEJA
MRLLTSVFFVLAAICVLESDAQWGYYSPYYGGGYDSYNGYGSYYPSSSYSYYPSYGYNNYGYGGYGGYGYGGYGWCGIRCRRFQRRLMWAQMMNPYMYGK